jgi:hypothetical protein
VGPTAANEVASPNATYEGGYGLGRPGAVCDGDTAVALDGSAYLHAGENFDFENQVPFTVEAWFQIDETFVGAGGLAAKTGANDGWLLYVTRDRRVVFERRQSSMSPDYAASGQLALNAYHHAVASYDGMVMRVFVNGLEALPSLSSSAIGPCDEEMTIGATDGGVQNRFVGLLDEVALYDRALLPNEVMDHYQAALGM